MQNAPKKDPGDAFDYVCRGKTVGQPRHLVILLHGYGRNAAAMEKMADEVELLLPEALIVMPQGPEICAVPEDDRGNLLKVPQVVRADRLAARQDRRQWFAVDGSVDDIHRRLAAVAEKLNIFIDNKRDLLGLKDSQIALMGFSQGGGQALYTALHRPQALGCVVAHSAPYFGLSNIVGKHPVLYLYGIEDEEFSLTHYQGSATRLAAHIDELYIEAVPGLSHKTSDQSRKIVARYIKEKLAP